MKLRGGPQTDLMRRAILAASAGFVLPRRGWAESREHAALCWKLEERGDTAHESATGAEDAIASRTGHAIWVGEGRNRALRLDGYSVWFKHDGAPAILHGGVVTVCAWIALESYPVHEAALLQLEGKSGEALRFSIDRWGYLQFGPHPGDPKANCKSSEPVLKAKWTHLAASFGDRGITLYRDGIPCGHLPSSGPDFKLADPVSLAIGIAPDCPVVADVFPTGVLNGLLRDVRVFDAELSGQAIAEIMEESKPDGAPDLQINGSWCASDPHRPIWHALPPRAWTNEPHGLIHWGGQYHLFYQKNPSGPYWGHIHWGHLTSPDLRRWTEMPVALSPEPGPDSEGCWSGSVIDHHGQLAILYTGGDGSRSSICLALSNDGVHFTKHVGNPIIPQPPEGHDFPEFRDPFVWREGDAYYLMIGSAVKDVGGTGLLYHSKDLVSWEYRKQIHKGDHKDSGTFWEMPIFVRAGNYHALAVCEVPGRASYWVGSWKDETFTPISSTPRRLELFNHLLSPTPMIDEDGQVVVMGIIPDERHPKETWAAGWAHLYSLPRVLSTDASGLLIQTPHKSIEQRTRQLASFPAINLNGETVSALEGVAETSFRLHATFKKGASRSISVILRRAPSGQEQTEILFEWESGRLVLDRSRSSLDPMVRRDRQEAEYLPLDKDSIRFDVFVDRSVLEVFIDDRATFATRIYPTLDSSCGIGFACTGIGARVEDVGVVRIERTI